MPGMNVGGNDYNNSILLGKVIQALEQLTKHFNEQQRGYLLVVKKLQELEARVNLLENKTKHLPVHEVNL